MKYVCQICGYIYDDAKEKVPFEQLPADWKCPLCGAAKTDFKPETADGEKEKPVTVPIEAELVNLSVGQLAALCSNLARGCEKQYKTEESKLFSELADYFTAAVPAISDATVEKLAKNLRQYRIIIAVRLRRQIFRQIVLKRRRRANARQGVLVQYDGKYASKRAAKE